ncbi:MAG: sugar-binding protein, partial [Algisphaera sp.]
MLKRTKPSHLFSRPLLALTLLFFLHGGHNACAQTAPTPGETLFLTWHDDPTTTMVAQWLDLGRLPAAMPGTSANASIALPKLPDTLHMDGHGEDWGTQGLRLDYLAQANGQWPDPTGFLATAKLGWTSKGLAVLVHVLDDEATESPNDEALWEADSIELFLGQGLGRSRALQIVLAPGIDPEHPKIRAQTLALAPRRMPQDLVVQAAAVKTEQGYTLEALIPWSNLPEINPKLNATFAFQLMINDVDGPFEKETFTWYPDTNSYANRHAMHTLRLAQEPDTTVRLMVKPRLDEELNQIVLDLGGEPRLIGETVTVQSGSKKLGSVTLENVLGFAGAVMPLPTDAQGTVPRVDAITVQLDDRIIARNLLPNSIWYVDPTPQAATVQLTTPTQTDPLAYASEAVPFGQTGWYVHRVSLTGLSPDTEYHLAVPDGVEKEDIQVKFKTAPATLDQPLVFAEGGDVGTSDAVPLLHNQAAAWDPLFGFVGGDCAYANGVKPKKWLAFLKHWHDNMVTAEGRMIPMLAIIGNHEVDGSYGKTKENAPFFYALFGPLYPNKGTYQT